MLNWHAILNKENEEKSDKLRKLVQAMDDLTYSIKKNQVNCKQLSQVKDEFLEGVKATKDHILGALRRMNISNVVVSDTIMIGAEQEPLLHKKLNFIRDQIDDAHAGVS